MSLPKLRVDERVHYYTRVDEQGRLEESAVVIVQLAHPEGWARLCAQRNDVPAGQARSAKAALKRDLIHQLQAAIEELSSP